MEYFKLYKQRDIEKLITKRDGEIRFGEKIKFLDSLESIENSKASYVLFGIPEDIGVRANHGKPGAAKAWSACLKSLLNIQCNDFTFPERLVLLGEIDCKTEMEKAGNIDTSDPHYYAKLGDLVEKIDDKVSWLVEKIVSAGKIPIIIGGGHNNAFANIKGASNANNKPLNVLNIDAHTDLRQLEHRHSGNGFSYAKHLNYLAKYAMFGLHKNYTPQYIFEDIASNPDFNFQLFEEYNLLDKKEQFTAYKSHLDFVKNQNFGFEVDCDAIVNFPSSAKSPAGFELNMIRNFISITSEEKNCKYLHLCEAAPTEENKDQVGKALAYFVTDFINIITK